MQSIFRTAFISGATLCVALTGCITPDPTPEAHFFQLQPSSDREPISDDIDIGPLLVGPVEVADYIDKPQIARRVGEHQIVYDEGNRWAESLEKNVSSVIVENLSSFLGKDEVYPFASIHAGEARASVEIRISRFEGTPGEWAILHAAWTVSSQNENVGAQGRRVQLEERVVDSSIKQVVAAQSKLLEEFSRIIAAGVIEILSSKDAE